MSKIEVKEEEIEGFKIKMVSINNFLIGLATEIGPRILYFATKNNPEENLFGIHPEITIPTIEGIWKIYGGHRLWSAPEAKPRSYSLDDKPIKIEIKEEKVIVHGNPERENSIKKEIEIAPFGKDSIQVIHRIQNIGRWPIKLGCWALTLMSKEGFVVIPVKPSKIDEEGLLPDRHISIWPYTSLNDERLKFTSKYIYVMKNSKNEKAFKIGTMANPNWAAYIVDDVAFIKKFSRFNEEYPDFGCNVEVYTRGNMLEFETLSPLRILGTSAFIEHVEIWKVLYTGKLKPEDKDIENKLEALLK